MGEVLRINTISEMHNYAEIGAPLHPLISFIDFRKHPFQKEIQASRVICNFYQISLKGQECGEMRYGRNTYDYQEGTLVYTAPGQVMEYPDNTDKPINSG